jgi:hypothetical protein
MSLPTRWLEGDLNQLARKGFIKPGANIGLRRIAWTHSYWGEIANGLITTDMSSEYAEWLRVEIGNLAQRIILPPRPRHFGGHQWYFVCPITIRLASVLWKPAGATRFAAGRPKAGKSPISRNLTTRQAGRMLERRGSKIG